jgi:hypothetical protein
MGVPLCYKHWTAYASGNEEGITKQAKQHIEREMRAIRMADRPHRCPLRKAGF